MEWSDQAKEVFARFKEDAANAENLRNLGALYWSSLAENLSAGIRDNGACDAFVEQDQPFVDFGYVPDILESFTPPAADSIGSYLQILTMSAWLKATVDELKGVHREETLRREIQRANLQAMRMEKQLGEVQESRKEIFVQQLSLSGGFDELAKETIDLLPRFDAHLLEVLRTRRVAARGKILSTDERKASAAREADLQKNTARVESLTSRISSEAFRGEIRSIGRQIADILQRIVQQEAVVAQKETEIARLQEKQHSVSPLELDNNLTMEIDYLKELVRLSAKRAHTDFCAILRPDQPFFTPTQVRECLDLVLEMDPRILRNDRVVFLGKPSVLLVPGNGQALYDWKYNRLVVPLVPTQGKFLDSFVAGIIEYRLDVDDDKTLLNSYCKLPRLKDVRSLFQIKGSFTKDYSVFMLSEAKGYRVLEKETRAWFEHEIAPRKTDIYCPPQYQPFSMSQAEFKKLLGEIETRLGDKPLDQCDAADLWAAGILYHQQGKAERALECIKAFVAKSPENIFGQYNLGQIAMAASSKSDAIAGFTEFTKRNPRSWWAGVARDHLRRLQA